MNITIIITAILSAFITLLSSWLANRYHNQRLEIQYNIDKKSNEDKILRERIEELFVKSNEYFTSLTKLINTQIGVMDDLITFEAAKENITDALSALSGGDRIMMIITFYFPQLKSEMSTIFKDRDQLNMLFIVFHTNKNDQTKTQIREIAENVKATQIKYFEKIDSIFQSKFNTKKN